MGINRSGGSLLARLLDGTESVVSYPMEVGFKFKDDLFGFIDKLTGSPIYIPDFDPKIDILDYFEAKQKVDPVYEWGKEKSEIQGVRKNYLEKAFYEKSVSTDFNFQNYQNKLLDYSKNIKNNYELYEAKHKAYFESWSYTKDFKFEHVVSHDSAGLFFYDFNKFFDFFPKSFVIIPIRNLVGYVAAEKTRIARQAIGTRRFSKPLPPNFLIRKFKNFSLDSIVRSWLIAFTRIRILQEQFGIENNIMVYRFENLVNKTDEHIKYICAKNNINFDNIFLKPTLMGKPWLGNSQQGKNNGINKDPNSYINKVLNSDEIEKIKILSNNVDLVLNQNSETVTDLTKIEEKYFYDYKTQKKYSSDLEKWAIYCSLSFRGFRDSKIQKPYFLQIIYYLFSKFVKFSHIPRLLKQKIFKSKGKQNYT
mgnify:CR=1 FL=1